MEGAATGVKVGGWRTKGLAVVLALPWLLNLPVTPDAVFINQVAAAAGWALWLWLARGRPVPRGASAALAAVLLCTAAAAAGMSIQGGAALMLLAAAAVLAAGTGACDEAQVAPVAGAFWLAGVCSAAVAFVQYVVPELADSWLVAAGSSAGRAVGNLRQPNHLATALLLAIAATVWRWQASQLRPWAAGMSIVAMVLALAMSASRTGALGLVVFVAWALADRRLPCAARRMLAATPLVYALAWGALAGAAALGGEHYYGSDRLAASGDISSSRIAIWRNALALIAENPWTGVGWGHFNVAWTLSPFPERPVAFFDHAHNLPLQLAVELGIPVAMLVLGLLLWSVWSARAAWSVETGGCAPPARSALAMLAVLALHSLLEYPLWYAYFLLPAAWALGVFIGSACQPPMASGAPRRPAAGWIRTASLLLALGALWALLEHRVVEQIFVSRLGAAPLAQRIQAGQRSFLFGHHADYAAVTTSTRSTDLDTFRRPLQQLIDVRLLIAYAEALKAHGLDAEALYAAQRLREFRRPDAQAWFKDCGATAPPWQCNERPVILGWRDLLR